MANKTTKNKPARKTLRANEYYNPKTKRYEYHYKDCFGVDYEHRNYADLLLITLIWTIE